ncbi:pfs domain-containing protein [Histoplasma capsulatum H143]|uniref:Pfs domain-containing protein n=1 Tax=Ajellomyces capsulatus (strain H143) TaxID=544712 RepID=C6HFF3_AJECH|nr:pfs domain-containing protein [Histoplasma capsulatum H143]
MGVPAKPKYTPDSYTVALICPKGIEFAAVEGMLEHTHPPIPMERLENAYTLGQIGNHNVVVAILSETGTSPAATAVTQTLNDFKDVVVSKPAGTFGGVVQFDRGKIYRDGRFERTGALSKPPKLLLSSAEKLHARHIREGNSLMKHVSTLLSKFPKMKKGPLGDPGSVKDMLFEARYPHPGKMNTCKSCLPEKLVNREPRPEAGPEIHYGTIGSSNLVIKDGITRNKLYDELGIICVEMEAAGLMDEFPCLVVRGISDYADSHKNKEWQPYAAATAAAYVKELLEEIPSSEVSKVPRAVDSLKVWVGMIRKEIVDAAIKGKLDEFKNDCSNLKREVLGEWTARVVDLPSVHQFFAKWFHSPRLLYGPWTPDPRAVWADTTRDDAERMLAWCDDCGKNSSGYGVIAKYWTLWALFEYAGVVSATLR